MSIKSWIRNWLNSNSTAVLRGADVEASPSDQTSISIMTAINGKVLTLRTYQPNKTSNSRNMQSDWVTELYLVPEGESLTEALTMLLMMRGIK
jgi:hypothetical protein